MALNGTKSVCDCASRFAHNTAPRIAGRNDEQIAKRWRDVLSPDLQPEMPWTSREDALLRSLFLQLGSKWTLMADSFPGRNGIQCRNRFRRLNNSRACKRGLVSGISQNDDAKVPNAPDRASSEMTISSSGQEQSVELNPANGRHVNIRATSSCSPGDNLDLAVAPPADALTHPGAVRQMHCSTETWDLSSSHAYDFSTLPVSPPDMALDFTHTEFGSWLQDSANNQLPTPAPGSGPATPFAEWFAARILGDETLRPGPGNLSPVYAPPSQGTIEDSTSSACDPTQTPIRDMYGLCVALEQGQETLTLSTDLIRSLIRDAARR